MKYTLSFTGKSYYLGDKNLNSIDGIEALNHSEAEYLCEELCGTKELIKGHEVFIVDLKGYFGLSALVFANKKHIYYADDFQLHYNYKKREELPEYYKQKMERILFTEEELAEPVKTYDEYTRKGYFVRNYWIMQHDYVSIFSENEDKKHKKYPVYCQTCFCWVKDKEISDKAEQLMKNVSDSYRKAMLDDEVFREMIAYELANHEAGYTGEYGEALDALGISFGYLSPVRQKIVIDELNKLIRRAE